MYPSEILCELLFQSINLGTQYANQLSLEFIMYIKRKNDKLLKKLFNVLKNAKGDSWELLRTQFLKDSSVPISCTRKFYELLEKYHYLIEDEILECVSALSNSKTPLEDISFWCRCPWIETITYDNKTKMYTIVSVKGNFTFLPIQEMYPNELVNIRNSLKMNYANNYCLENFDYNCHTVSYEFSKLNPYDYAVTTICPNKFPGSFWLHSYIISYNHAYVNDISNRFVMPINDFEKLLNPCVLDSTKGEDIPLRLEIIKKEGWPFYNDTKNVPLKTLAFYHYDTLYTRKRRDRTDFKKITWRVEFTTFFYVFLIKYREGLYEKENRL